MLSMFTKAAAIAGGGWVVWGKWIGLALLVAASYYWTFTKGEDSSTAHWEPLLVKEQRDYKDFRTGVKHTSELAALKKEMTGDAYDKERQKEKLRHEKELASINSSLVDYERDRLRDAKRVHTSERRVHSLTSLLEIADSKNRQAELDARLEYVNRGFAKLAHRGDLAIQRTIQCKKEIQIVPNLELTD